ncbi:MAG: hypothetical protein F6K28_23735 [Microcoleus sp. SIO2G3]|nr:hypothetical protein [Microcoleus sp. SIO2G3]
MEILGSIAIAFGKAIVQYLLRNLYKIGDRFSETSKVIGIERQETIYTCI